MTNIFFKITFLVQLKKFSSGSSLAKRDLSQSENVTLQMCSCCCILLSMSFFFVSTVFSILSFIVFRPKYFQQIHILDVLFMLLFCNVSLPHNAIPYTNALTMRFFQLEADGSTDKIFLLIESFLCQCNATSYFTFASAVFGYHTSKSD